VDGINYAIQSVLRKNIVEYFEHIGYLPIENQIAIIPKIKFEKLDVLGMS